MYLEEYYQKALDGEEVIGIELKTALRQLNKDLEDDRFIYDTSEAELRFEFMERFVKLTKSPFYGQPMKLMLWQKALIEAMYSFKWKDTDLRRFKKVLLLIARKNTKSETCNALGLTELMLGNAGSDIVCSSNDDNQANILYEGINTMREMFDQKGKRTHKNLSFIKNKKNGSKIFKLSDRTRNKEGRNIDFAIIDEVHEMKDNIIVKSIETSQSTKDEPMLILITTEGFVNDGFLDNELKYARNVLNGEIEDPTYLVWLYSQDSEAEIYQNERSWLKSNPTLGKVKKWKYLQDQLNKAKYDKAERMFTLAKDFNIKQNNGEAWLMLDDVENDETFNLEDFRGSYCLAGIDMSETTDLTAASILLMKPNDPKKYVYTKYFLPEAKVYSKKDDSSGADYIEWLRQGLIEVTAGNENDLSKIADWFYYLYETYDIKMFKAGYDQKFSKDFLKKMDEYGFEYEMVYQSKAILSNPMKLVEADLKSKNINYNNNPILKWNFLNCSMEMDRLGQIIAVKINNQPSRRIDGAVSTIILFEMYRRYRNEFTQMIERR